MNKNIMKIIKRRELMYGAKNYIPENVCISHGHRVYLFDVNKKRYLDFISAYSAVNQGHCHPRLVKAATEQLSRLTLTSRALYNDRLGLFMEKMCKTFNYDKVLPMNTGVEGGETALKIARKWGYEVKGVDSCVNLFCENNFWGRTLAAASSSTDKSCYNNFGPYMRGFDFVPYNCLDILEKRFIENPNIISFMFEPIQGEAGIIVPDDGYIKGVRELCNKYNVLMIADEVQTGMGRTGGLLACDHENVKPDILILGKALSGGILPISAVLADSHIMDVITPGTHGSTFGGNPLAAVVGMEAVDVTIEEKLSDNSEILGKYFRKCLQSITKNNDKILKVRGRGLMNGIELVDSVSTQNLIDVLRQNGLLTKSTHDTVIRLAPPLVIDKGEVDDAIDIIYQCLKFI